jgi:phenylpyruvate tautomerase PptA (4-oxalocrotonate tautomerase family)
MPGRKPGATLPLTRIDMAKGKSSAYRLAICEALYRAMRETFAVPEEDRFMIVNEHDAENFQFSRSYLGIARSADFALIQITANNTRTVEQKKAFFARAVELLAENPGLRKEDVFISLVEVGKENWSFGNGIAQYA